MSYSQRRRPKINKMCGKTNSVFSQMIFRSPLLLLCCLITNFCILAITRVPVHFFVFWLCHRACGILVPRPGIEPMSSAVGVWSLNYWTTREAICSETQRSYDTCFRTILSLLKCFKNSTIMKSFVNLNCLQTNGMSNLFLALIAF